MTRNDTLISLAVNSWINGRVVWSKADLREAILVGADLSEADLRGADLRGAETLLGNCTFTLRDKETAR